MRRIFLAPGLLLVLIGIGGRFTLDRAGFPDLAWVDLRVIGVAVALVVLLIDLARRRPQPRVGREGWLVAASIFLLFQIASALWSPPAARIGPQTVDLILLAVLILAFYYWTLGDPERAILFTFQLFWLAAIVFALAAIFINGPGEQGRYSAFGGGPNVFVRIEILGVISAIAMFLSTRRLLPLLVTPLFLLAAVLSGSRAGLMAGGAVGLVALAKIRGRLRAGPVLACGAFLLTAGLVIWFAAPPEFTSLFQERFVQQTVQEQYLSDRTDIWAAAIRMFTDHPLAGAGLDGFYGLIGVNQMVEYPHNYVLAVAAEGGLIGLGLLTGALILWTRTVRGGGALPRATGLAVAAAVFVALSSLFSGDYYDARLAWTFAAMAAAAAVSRARTVPSAEPARVKEAVGT
ncbi:polymerase [Actinoplanes sp. SE50]|uniref:O-antigen ligase family protein n=1 Tax=unclassified Actinoplanes TaxID=2626549 RepID=UPI00023ECB83|nr:MULTISPECIES: O-antigen ligase family protein [unclassified Actinoplanes]AEV86528.1 Putative lipopolysaccharide biosynthesis protein [Actinoplanes sp. SE50/110]ATO84926.1 polymerase [Actinoplanes sp. SE50]SLM02335.1 polymerase [Actinoplanes sp. SE50/110]